MEYKNSYFAEFTQEVTTIELDYLNHGRYGHRYYDNSHSDDDGESPMLIRASKYSSVKGIGANDYDVKINEIAQHTLNELTLQSDEILFRVVKRLIQLDEHINDAWKLYFEQFELWSAGKFSSLNFEWKFFHFFNIPVTRSTGFMDDPSFEKGETTSDFFMDLHDAMMYKQGAIKWVLWHLREQLGIAHDEEERNPKKSGLPSVDNNRDTAKATRAVSRLKTLVDDECKINSGRKNGVDEKVIIRKVLSNWESECEKFGFGGSEKSIDRYLTDIGKSLTPKKFIRQLVRQFFKPN